LVLQESGVCVCLCVHVSKGRCPIAAARDECPTKGQDNKGYATQVTARLTDISLRAVVRTDVPLSCACT